jgi:hypothetical protein
MKRLTVTSIAAAMLLALVSCGGSPRGPAGSSYLTAGKSQVAFIRWWATSDGHLHGTITANDIGGSAPNETLAVSREPFTGSLKGSSVTLTFAGLLFLRAAAHGIVSGGTLRLRLPQPNGGVHLATFGQSDVTGYNGAVATLNKTIRRANLRATSQRAKLTPRQAASERAAQSSLSALYRDSSLAFSGALAHGLARFAHDVAAARSHLATEQHDAAGGNAYCKSALTASGDAQSVAGDLKTVQGDVASIMPDISAIRDEVAIAKAHIRALTRARLPVPSSAATVIANAKASVGWAIAAVNACIDQVNAIGLQARSIADRLATGRCSGARSGNWAPPVPRIRLRSRRSAEPVLLGGGGQLVGELVSVQPGFDLVQVGDPGAGLDLTRHEQRAAVLVR